MKLHLYCHVMPLNNALVCSVQCIGIAHCAGAKAKQRIKSSIYFFRNKFCWIKGKANGFELVRKVLKIKLVRKLMNLACVAELFHSIEKDSLLNSNSFNNNIAIGKIGVLSFESVIYISIIIYAAMVMLWNYVSFLSPFFHCFS